MSNLAPAPDRSGLALLKACAIGFGITLACLLPPIIHFFTGPVGPFIGGFIGGSRVEAEGGEGALIGLRPGFDEVANEIARTHYALQRRVLLREDRDIAQEALEHD